MFLSLFVYGKRLLCKSGNESAKLIECTLVNYNVFAGNMV